MGFGEAVKSVLSKYVTFSGRSCRSEFWYFQLFMFIALFVLEVAAIMMPFLLFVAIAFSLVMFLPTLAVSVRRLHDIGKSGWWILIGLIPLVGFIVLLIWYVKHGDMSPNEYGDDPLAGMHVA